MNSAPLLDLEAEYNNRARVPEYPEIMAQWETDAAAFRDARRDSCELGIPYGAHPRQTVDIFHPEQTENGRPLILFIHGGYWRSLDPRLFSHLAAGAVAHGFPVALPGYRLCPEVTIADIIGDLREACAALCRRFGRNIVASGHSAGGHLAAAMVATDWRAVEASAPERLVRWGLAISGIFDLEPLVATSVNESLRLDVRSAREVSPAYWPVPGRVAFEAWVGGTESSEYFRQNKVLAAHWGAAGAQVSVESLPGLNHFTAPAPLADASSDLTAALVTLAKAATAEP